MVFGNFDVVTQTATINFPSAGTWYSYLSDSVANLSSASQFVNLKPGEYYVFTSKNVRSSVLLPVTWLSFSAKKTLNNAVELNWSTASEINNHHFDVQRSRDGINYETVGTVAASNMVSAEQHYKFNDNFPIKGTNYYRIKQVDLDGRYTYSATQKINMDAVARLWKLYPNPTHDITAIYTNASITSLQVIVTDLSGKVVYRTTVSNTSAGQRVEIPVQQFGKGVYMMKVNADNNTSTEKLVIQ